MVFEKKTTALNPAVGAAAEQSSQNMYVESIADLERKINEEIDHPGVCEVDNAGGNGIPESDWTDKQDEEEIYRIMRQMADPGYLPTMNMAQLYDQVYRAKPPVIENLLYPGTYLFVGAPKLGKSFLMLQIAYHAATGTPLWEYPARQNTVLYLALEDDHRRLQDRLYRMFGTECTEHLYFATRADPLNGNLITQMRSFISSHQGTGLIIIDTLQKVRECADDRYSYASDYDVITKLKDFAEQSGICLLLVHHTRKQQADDKFEMISGRDQPDQRLHLNRNPETLLWDLETADMQVIRERPEPVLSAVAQLVTEESPTWTGTPTELAAAVGSDLPPNKLTMKLGINASRLFNEYGISFEKTRTRSSRQIMLRRNVTGA